MSLIHLKIITPKKIVREDEVVSVTVPSSDGEITILPRHANLFSLLAEGIITIKKKDSEDYLAIGGGYVETNGKELHILVSRAYGQDEIDETFSRNAIQNAQKILKETKEEPVRAEAAAVLRRSLLDMKLLRRKKRSGTA